MSAFKLERTKKGREKEKNNTSAAECCPPHPSKINGETPPSDIKWLLIRTHKHPCDLVTASAPGHL